MELGPYPINGAADKKVDRTRSRGQNLYGQGLRPGANTRGRRLVLKTHRVSVDSDKPQRFWYHRDLGR